jgi:ribulose-bisphosphate carboxylase large chain
MFNIFKKQIDPEKYFTVRYFLSSQMGLKRAALDLAIGQSVGNPNERSVWESDELFEAHSCIILEDDDFFSDKCSGEIDIAFPLVNFDFDEDGITHILVNIMGGQLDISHIEKCHVLDINFPEFILQKHFKGPKFGINGIREFTKCYDKPLLGGIVKPKTGLKPDQLLSVVKEMVEGGVNFIKEDEILSGPSFCKIEDRVPLISDYIRDKNVIYCFSIHSDPSKILKRAEMVYKLGGNGIHVNFWTGLGIYKDLREMDLPLFVHFQKSGDKILTNPKHDFHIYWPVIVKLAGMMGVDFIHAGMIGGYYKWQEESMEALKIARNFNILPALSCGFNPSLTQSITNIVGVDYLANVGGSLHSHPLGTLGGTKAMRQSIDGNYESEYYHSLEKWQEKS